MTPSELVDAGFDRKSLRYILSWKDIKKLSIKHVTREELWKAKQGWYYNPIRYYPKYARLLANEQGYDDQYRYILDLDSPTK